ncbi:MULTISPECIES: UDP-N-acetylmuramoyl-tripeptide--D-alanyl-D-alanine ligase [unclassified Streptomyces]|uniref:UDP-N-acetylmuramoyl-tripeptide--D-alanyl-D- alanine ligase n=1 Tax=unclassified Streptomyces TaxID=2593676 RepID=UPI0035E07C81
MITLTMGQIARATGGRLDHVEETTVVTAPISFDSRDVHRGGLFACLPGRHTDGHTFAGQAVADGAAAVVATQPVGVPAVIVGDVLEALSSIAEAIADRYNGTVIGLTGSAGKTSTKDILEAILSLDGPTVATHRSFNNQLGFPVTVSRVQEDSRYLVLEMGARGKGHIKDLCETVQPTIATVLGIGSAHLGEFGSREAIADAKAEIVRALPAHGVAVLYGDDPLVTAMAQQTQARLFTFGSTVDCDLSAENVHVGNDGRPAFTLRYEGKSANIQLKVHGAHNVVNAAAAAATALAAGVPFDRVVEGLHRAELSSGGRMEVIEANGITVINDAFNASPESVMAALEALHDIAGSGRRRVVVLGEMAELGTHAVRWHQRVADQVVGIKADLLFGLGDSHIHDVISTVRTKGILAAHLADPDPATVISRELLPGDVVLVKGANSLGLEAVAKALSVTYS